MMALLRGIVKSSECFMRNPSVIFKNSLNPEFSYSAKRTTNIPPAPKKPLTGYMIFCKDHRRELLRKQPNLSGPEQIKQLAAQWNCLSLALKEPYEDKARKATVEYGEAHKRYYESLTEEQRQEIALAKAEKKKARLLSKLKKDLQENNFPKSPLSAYALFVQSQAKETNIGKATKFMKDCAEKWNALSEDHKKKLEEESKRDKIRYNDELEKWRTRMEAEGKSELLQRYEELKGKGKSVVIHEVPKRSRAKKEVVK